MFKKRLNGAVFGFVGLLSVVFLSCSEKELAATDGGEIATSVTVEVPEVFKTRAVPNVYPTGTVSYSGESGYPSIGNVDLDTHSLTFTVGVYIEKSVDGNKVYIPVDQQSKTDVKDDKADFNFRLMEGQKYRIVAYADFSGAPQEHLDNISMSAETGNGKAPAFKLNDELCDAFFVTQEFTAGEHMTVILKRPFGKLRLIARDFNTFAAGEVLTIDNIKVTYTDRAVALATDSFNAVTGEFNTAENLGREFTAAPVIYAKEHEGAKTSYAAVFTMYLPANFGTPVEADDPDYYDGPVAEGTPVPQSWMYPFNVEVTYKNESGALKTIERSFDIDIPVKRNWLTTIDAANFWTDNSNITVSIDHRFDGFIDIEPETIRVTTEKQLRDAVLKIENSPEKKGRIVLGAPISVTGKFGVDVGYNKENVIVNLDLNGYKISTIDTYSYTANFGAIFNVWGANTLVIDDSSSEATGAVENLYAPTPTITSWRYGSNIVINSGKFICNGNHECVYLGDTKEYVADQNLPHSTLTVNGGWFENMNPTDKSRDCLINIYNGPGAGYEPDAKGFGHVHLNGGSYVDFNPANGDNICHNLTNQWVDDNHTVLTETVNGHTVYTVIPDETPEYY